MTGVGSGVMLPKPPNPDPDALWTVADVAAFLRVSRSWVYHRAEAAELPVLRIGGLLRFDPSRIKAYARGDTVPAASQDRGGVATGASAAGSGSQPVAVQEGGD